MVGKQSAGMPTSLAASFTDSENTPGSGGDNKKRNKLGYHRTAVACGHCRRRKIRCVPAPDPSEARCQNCIRLRKDCQFYPVDHLATSTKASRSESRTNSGGFEPDASENSPASAIPGSTISEYDDSDASRRASIANTWIDTHGNVSSPGHFEQTPQADPQGWTATPTQTQSRGQFPHGSQHGINNDLPWMPDNQTHGSQYRHQSFPDMSSSIMGQYSLDPHTAYQNTFYGNERHNSGRQSSDGVLMTGVVQHLSSPTFHDMAEMTGITMSAEGHTDHANVDTQANLHLTQEPSYYGQHAAFSPQMPQVSPGGHWYGPQLSQQGLRRQYLSSQRHFGS